VIFQCHLLRPSWKKRKTCKGIYKLITILITKRGFKESVRVNHPLHYKGLAFYQSNYGAIHDITLGSNGWGRKKRLFFLRSWKGHGSVPNTNNFIRVLKAEHEVHNFGEGVQIVLSSLTRNPDPSGYWRPFRNSTSRGRMNSSSLLKRSRRRNIPDYRWPKIQASGGPGLMRLMIFASLFLLLFPSEGSGKNSQRV